MKKSVDIPVILAVIAVFAWCFWASWDAYIAHPTGTLGQPLPTLSATTLKVAQDGLAPEAPYSRACVCKRELNLLPADARGVTKETRLMVSQGNMSQDITVEEVAYRTFFHKIGRLANDEYRYPEQEPRIFVRTDKDLIFDPGARIKVTIKTKGAKIAQRKE